MATKGRVYEFEKKKNPNQLASSYGLTHIFWCFLRKSGPVTLFSWRRRGIIEAIKVYFGGRVNARAILRLASQAGIFILIVFILQKIYIKIRPV